jgi:hypothetical protein
VECKVSLADVTLKENAHFHAKRAYSIDCVVRSAFPPWQSFRSAEGKKIGEGSYSDVYRFTEPDGSKTVVKILPVEKKVPAAVEAVITG